MTLHAAAKELRDATVSLERSIDLNTENKTNHKYTAIEQVIIHKISRMKRIEADIMQLLLEP